MSLLKVRNLQISFPEDREQQEVVQEISFSVDKGEIFGIVGESGSGKSMTAHALLGLLPEESVVTAEELTFSGESLLNMTPKEWLQLRGKRMAMVFQEPMTSLNPVQTVEKQVEEVLLLHEPASYKKEKEKRREKVLEALSEAGLENPGEMLGKYPHQMSGGQRQRVMIAMAMLLSPELLIADEPTTALDADTQIVILKQLKYYAETYGTAVLFISHDLSLVQGLCDRVAVMKDGKIVEQGTAEEIFHTPQTEYTKALLAAAKGRNYKEETNGEEAVPEKYREVVLSAKHAQLEYKEKDFLGRVSRQEVITDATFELYRGEILGLVGRSGGGKSTLLKALTGLLKPVSGEITAKHPQMVFQDPYGSLNPARKIGWILEEALKLSLRRERKEKLQKNQRKALVREVLNAVELQEDFANRYVRELSGGQRQRVAIAAALIQKPEVVVLDEPISALDVTVQEQILSLLYRLKKERGMSYLFVSHDRALVARFCDRVLLLENGRIREFTDGKENRNENATKEREEEIS